MRQVVTVLLLSLFLCSRLRRESTQSQHEVTDAAAPTPNNAPSADAALLAAKSATSLAKVFRAVGLEATEQGPIVLVAKKKIGVAARINNRTTEGARSILAAD